MEMESKDRTTSNGYALSGKIMMSAILVLFFVVILMVCLHLYARWYLLRLRRRQLRQNRERRGHLVFYEDPANPNSRSVAVAKRGLDDAVLRSLPLFVYSPGTGEDLAECAVCLSEFEEKEMGRTLPKCGHSFHVECIDMWFHSHSTCPLCRSLVEPVIHCPIQVVSSSSSSEITEVESSHNDLCRTCQEEEDHVGPSTSSSGGRRKPAGFVDFTIEVPRRQPNLEDESGTESPASQAFRSPVYRMLSFTRILSREIREALSPSAASSGGCGGAAVDIERGETRT
ncbi:hypothetical protein K2173_022522 [Erythroxylum novogranatense]|uniref:RING-type E3 ubiquitin transferase n=1 Tax=Erythroxylum novogranatense TaxID=1862640 RepID=A0AAV8TJQ5_9ROSI|nr:hypothetical protein K2173_022522 [Erythroxylum novogranatense]